MQRFHVVLFIMLYGVDLTFKSVHETLVRDLLIESIEQYFHGCLFVDFQMIFSFFLTY